MPQYDTIQRIGTPHRLPDNSWTVKVEVQQPGTPDIPVQTGEILLIVARNGKQYEAVITEILEIIALEQPTNQAREIAICRTELRHKDHRRKSPTEKPYKHPKKLPTTRMLRGN